MTEPTLEQKIEANRRAKCRPVRSVSALLRWKDADGSTSMALVPQGMQVADNLKAFFWAERETYGGLMAAVEKAGATLGDSRVLNDDNEIIAFSHVEPDDDAEDLAWLSCMFMEMMHGRLALSRQRTLTAATSRAPCRCMFRSVPPMSELELPKEIRDAIETGFDTNGMRYTARHTSEYVRQLRRHNSLTQKIIEMMTASPMLKDEDDPQAHVRSALLLLDAGERSHPTFDDGRLDGSRYKFVDLSWPNLVHNNGEGAHWDGAAYVPVEDSTLDASGRSFSTAA